MKILLNKNVVIGFPKGFVVSEIPRMSVFGYCPYSDISSINIVMNQLPQLHTNIHETMY